MRATSSLTRATTITAHIYIHCSRFLFVEWISLEIGSIYSENIPIFCLLSLFPCELEIFSPFLSRLPIYLYTRNSVFETTSPKNSNQIEVDFLCVDAYQNVTLITVHFLWNIIRCQSHMVTSLFEISTTYKQ